MGKSGKEREQNESFESELRPWNAPAPIDEMEFRPKSQESDKHKKRKGKWKREYKKNKKERETWENTFIQNSQSFSRKRSDEKCEYDDMQMWNNLEWTNRYSIPSEVEIRLEMKQSRSLLSSIETEEMS